MFKNLSDIPAFNESILWNQYSNKISSIWKESIVLWEEVLDWLIISFCKFFYDANEFNSESMKRKSNNIIIISIDCLNQTST